jgi:sugar transferase (PEP-CTERM system associated)
VAYIQVFNLHVPLPYVLLSFLEVIVLVTCGYISVIFIGVTDGVTILDFDLASIQYGLIFAFVMQLSTFSMGSYEEGVRDRMDIILVRLMVSYCLLGVSAMVVLYYLIPVLYVGRGVLFGAVISALVLVFMLRWAFYSSIGTRLRRRILVLGTGQRAKKILENVDKEGFIGSDIIGFVPSDPGICEIKKKWLLDPGRGLRYLVEKHHIDEIVVAPDERRQDLGAELPWDDLLDCKLSGTRISEVIDFYEREFSRIELSEINTSWMVFSSQFKYSQFRDKCKRIFDLLIGVSLMSLAWPFMLLTALAISLESGFPVIYTQQRVGYKGRLFRIYKFRSMRKDAEIDGQAVWAKVNDNRVTRVGAFIRNTRLDELPQILNVLKGEMSFVGPRPERPEFVKSLVEQLPLYDSRHRVKPGLMGWAQLKYAYGASMDDAANKLVFDLYYVKNHSILLDLIIVVRSVEVILLGKGVR